jgi:hypothetical protein
MAPSRWARAMPVAPATRPQATVQRSMLVIIFHLLADPTNTFCELGADYYEKQSTQSSTPAAWSANPKPSAPRHPLIPRPDQPLNGPLISSGNPPSPAGRPRPSRLVRDCHFPDSSSSRPQHGYPTGAEDEDVGTNTSAHPSMGPQKT